MSRHPFRPYAVALGVLWGLPLLLVVGLHFSLPTTNPGGQCSGIGFGCTPPPADAVVLLAMFAAPVLLLAGLVVCIVIAVVRARRRSRP
ncbi:hypothetical protein [Terrabacter sp. 2RAF25]|uniref:hypothetical protein n=1 Tax=Terrabacter sp. 2RAF25 TaxID=3232998 RepID=UPI003F9DACAD